MPTRAIDKQWLLPLFFLSKLPGEAASRRDAARTPPSSHRCDAAPLLPSSDTAVAATMPSMTQLSPLDDHRRRGRMRGAATSTRTDVARRRDTALEPEPQKRRESPSPHLWKDVTAFQHQTCHRSTLLSVLSFQAILFNLYVAD